MAAPGPREAELLALLAARDQQLVAARATSNARAADAARLAEATSQLASARAATGAAQAERDAARAERDKARAERDVAQAERDGARGASDAGLAAARGALSMAFNERDAALAAAEAERELSRAVLARDKTLADAISERDAQRRRMALPNVRTALLGESLIGVLPRAFAAGYASDLSQCVRLCGATWRLGDPHATNDVLVRSLEEQCGARAAHAAVREDFGDPAARRS